MDHSFSTLASLGIKKQKVNMEDQYTDELYAFQRHGQYSRKLFIRKSMHRLIYHQVILL